MSRVSSSFFRLSCESLVQFFVVSREVSTPRTVSTIVRRVRRELIKRCLVNLVAAVRGWRGKRVENELNCSSYDLADVD